MPELPEVQTVVDTLAPLVVGRRIDAVLHLRDDIVCPPDADLRTLLTGRSISGISRRGKRIVFHCDTGDRWFVHLGMTGRLTVQPANASLLLHTHLILDVGENLQLRFVDPRRFGGVFWLGSDAADVMGPEPLTLRPALLFRRLQQTRRPIKSALLDQHLIAGIGNIYADEALFAAKIHPLAPANRLDPKTVAKLSAAIKRVLRKAIRHGGSSVSDYVDAAGRRGTFQLLHRVYDRANEPCRLCRASIIRIVVAGRSTHFCPRCQKLPGIG